MTTQTSNIRSLCKLALAASMLLGAAQWASAADKLPLTNAKPASSTEGKSGQTAVAIPIESPVVFPQKTVKLQKDTKSTPVQTGSNNKQVNSSGGALGPIGAIIDDGGAAGVPMDTVSISAAGSISPLGSSWTITPDTALPLSAWKTVRCAITTEYFTTVTGSQPNNDVITTTPTLSISNNAVSFVCPYKSSAHALNIAKSVTNLITISISHVKNGMSYTYSGWVPSSCTRASKTTTNFTCS